MTFAPQAAACVTVDLGSGTDLLFTLPLFAIPIGAIVVIARTARRHPSRTLLRQGRRPAGILAFRWGLLLTAVSVLIFTGTLLWTPDATEGCNQTVELTAFVTFIGILVGALLVGGGWAYAVRASWVVLATIAALDALLLYSSVLITVFEDDPPDGLLLLAFAIHGVCSLVATRWSFTARNLGPIERAKAGEAGRTLCAVWVFLSAYTVLGAVRGNNGIFQSAAGSAVLGALTLGALAVTMGSGYTKYSEAINAAPPRDDPASDNPASGEPASDNPASGESE